MGGGRKYFTTKRSKDREYPKLRGSREDEDLIENWLEKHKDVKAEYVWNKEQFDEVNPSTTDKLLGLMFSLICLKLSLIIRYFLLVTTKLYCSINFFVKNRFRLTCSCFSK